MLRPTFKFLKKKNVLLVFLLLSVLYSIVLFKQKSVDRFVFNHKEDFRGAEPRRSRLPSITYQPQKWRPTKLKRLSTAQCRLSNCFDFNRCKPGQKMGIHIYPEAFKVSSISSTYQKILSVIETSSYIEPNASKACLFISRYDYLDRDPLSPDFQKNLPTSPSINNGKNHIFFNLYSGTWPDYNEMDFAGYDPGYSMIFKASSSYKHFRPDFDISLPLFSKNHPKRGATFLLNDGEAQSTQTNHVNIKKVDDKVPKERSNLMVFKGKRYTHGIGSETRNMLHHLHNDRDILVFTTCKHGKRWKDIKDERCTKDILEYEKFDYQELMTNSTFCLVPRGRRLGSFRFLEALSVGCIPVLLSNNWVKPFDSVIDWRQAVIDADERNLLQLPEMLRAYDWRKIEALKSQSIAIYESYFSSVERIVITSLKILEGRIYSHQAMDSFKWNLVNLGFSGAIWLNNAFSYNLTNYPGFGNAISLNHDNRQSTFDSNQYLASPKNGYTAVIFVDRPCAAHIFTKLIRNLRKSRNLSKIVFIWSVVDEIPIPNVLRIASSQKNHPVVVVTSPNLKTVHAKLYPYEEIRTDAVLSTHLMSSITGEELDFAFEVWKSFPHRIVGFTARDHYFSENSGQWMYSSKWTNYYSMILLDCAFYHRYYSYLYTDYISTRSKALKSQSRKASIASEESGSTINLNNESVFDEEACIDLTFNFLVSHIIREAPIKVTQRKKVVNSNSIQSLINSSPSNIVTQYEAFNDRQRCLTFLSNESFSYMPLVKSQVRLDPVLFKDQVSTFRKKYRKMEQIL